VTVHDQLRSLLLSVRRRWRAEVVLRAVGRGAVLAAAPVLAGVGLAAWLALDDGALTALASTMGLAVLAAVLMTAWRLGRTPRTRQIARFVEERVATRTDVAPFDDVLVSAVDAAGPPESLDFRGLVVESAVRRLEAIGAAGIVTTRALRRAGAEAMAGVTVLAVSIALAWPMLARASEAAWITFVPQSIHVQVLPGDARVPAGQPLTIRATVRAGRNLLTRFTPRLTVEAGSEARTVAMTPDGKGFQFSFESIDRTFRYRVTAGSRRSEDYTVTALFGPRVARIDLRYEYPAFANLPPREERDGGDIYAPAGTRVRVRVHTDTPIASGQMVFAAGAKAGGSGALQRTGDRVLEGDLVLARDDSYRIGLTDRDGLRTSGDTEYFLRVMDDRPPDVRILRPAGDQQITPLEEVAIEARAEDDYGILRFELVYAVAGREPKVVAFDRINGTDLTRAGTHTLAAEDLGVQPGDVITYYARARDVGRGKRPTETRSDMFFLEIRPFSEEFVLAQSQAMSGMASEQIETLVAAQKEIINATWNIERRAASGAGRSAGDITAIAAAQAELRSRAEQITSRTGRGRGLIRFPQQLTPPRQLRGVRPPSDPVGAAISAMTRAIDQLEGQRTGEALSHEMAALQGLLQAQAEVRRREVAQQAGASMGGLGRQGQDLSALFDKELQRQQRTNYETRSQSDTRADRQEGESALDRIHDLARRQEELSRRQRELANAAQTGEELKRQLEKLTREQEALRQQAEELARQLGQQAAQPQRGAAPQPNQTGGGAMRDATEQMRSAAGELQRQSPATAADRGERAAAGLRQLEQQMRRDNPEAQQRAAGEVRLEAQQIADEQRRIAGEAARLAKGDPANADAWRRLSGEKDKLADRVDALQRTAEQLAGADKPSPQGPRGKEGQTAAAAREIARQQIAGRMRETARHMREAAGADGVAGRAVRPAPRPGAAEAEQQIARALDQIVDQLGGAADAEDLSRELDQARAMRDRLDRLERQVREADARNSAGRQGQGRATGSGTGGGPGPSASPSPSPREEAQRLRDQYAKELQGARESLSRLERSSPGTGLGGTSPEQHEWSAVDKGTEAFKQDFSKWESLRKDVDSALDRYEASVIARAARKSLQDRLSAGGSDRVPDDYRRLIARYYESLARKK
jgi:hypothetical protein